MYNLNIISHILLFTQIFPDPIPLLILPTSISYSKYKNQYNK